MNKKGSKHAFWQALVFAVIVFSLGLILGFFLENSRENQVQEALVNSELNFFDEQLRNNVIEGFNVECNKAVESTYRFADRVYAEASKLEEYDNAHKFGNVLELLHKRYDILRMMIWNEAKSLKEKCNEDFHIVAYLYDYNAEELNQKAVQASLGRVLADFKEKYGKEVLLIPLAGNLGVESIEIVKEKYNIDKLPVVVIDGKKVLKGLITADDFEKEIFD